MTCQERIVAMTRAAGESFYRNCEAVPEEKREWKPAETARTVLDQAQECATTGNWIIPLIETGEPRPFTPEIVAMLKEERQSLKTIADCASAARDEMEKLAEVILAVPDSALDDVISLPFAEGMTMSRAEVMMMTYWNYVYHTGQVAYIQRLYGDVEMHA